MKMEVPMSNSSDKVLCFLFGASVGSIVALLYAPKSGQETRDEISRRANDGRDFLERKVDEGRQFVEDGGRRVSSEVTSLVDRGKGEVGEFVDKGRDVVERQKEQFAAAFEAGKEAYLNDKDSSD
jgi:gas vesicle protein